MKTLAVCLAIAFASFIACLSLAGGEPPKKEAPPAVNEHASLAAYPQAVISLKDAASGMLFYVESNGRRLVAFDKSGAIKWNIDVLSAAKIDRRGTPVVRHLLMKDGVVWATCARSHFVTIDPQTGKAEFAGND